LKTSAALNRETKQDLEFADFSIAQILFGDLNRNLHTVEQAADVEINARGNTLSILGKSHSVELAIAVLEQLYELIKKGYPVFSQDIAFGLKILSSSPTTRLEEIFLDKVYITSRNRVISPKSVNQNNHSDKACCGSRRKTWISPRRYGPES